VQSFKTTVATAGWVPNGPLCTTYSEGIFTSQCSRMPSPPKPWEAGGAQAANNMDVTTSLVTSTGAAPAIPARTTTTGLTGNTTGKSPLEKLAL
jgi:hypothetical protein